MSSPFESPVALKAFKQALVGAGVAILPDMKGPVDLYQGDGVDEILTAVTRKIRKDEVTADFLRDAFIRDGVTAVALYRVLDMGLLYPELPTSIVDPVTLESKPITEEEAKAAVEEASQIYLLRAYFRKENK